MNQWENRQSREMIERWHESGYITDEEATEMRRLVESGFCTPVIRALTRRVL